MSFAVLEWTAGRDVQAVLGNIVLKGHAPGRASAEVGYWTAPGARGRGVASGALSAITAWSFQSLDPDGLRYIELPHQAGDHASCRVAQKSGYALTGVRPAKPPEFPEDGHLHSRYSPRTGPGGGG